MHQAKRPRLDVDETMAVKDPKTSFQVMMEKTMDFTLTHSETSEQCNISELLRELYGVCHHLNAKCNELHRICAGKDDKLPHKEL